MELRELRYFVEIAKEHNITRAAEKLYVSQPALSKMIKKLEKELEVPLFIVRPNGVSLTDYGEELFAKAVPVINEFDALKGFISDIRGGIKGTLRVGVTPMMGTLYMVDLIVDFCNRYPGIQLKLNENGTNELRQELVHEEIDLAICLSEESSDKLEEAELIHDEMVVCVPHNHSLADSDAVSLRQMKGELWNFYGTASALNDKIRRKCIENGFEPMINMVSSKSHMILQMTARGRGLCMLPRPWAEHEAPESVRLLPIRESFPWVCCIVKKAGIYQSCASRIFERYVIDSFSNMHAEGARKASF